MFKGSDSNSDKYSLGWEYANYDIHAYIYLRIAFSCGLFSKQNRFGESRPGDFSGLLAGGGAREAAELRLGLGRTPALGGRVRTCRVGFGNGRWSVNVFFMGVRRNGS